MMKISFTKSSPSYSRNLEACFIAFIGIVVIFGLYRCDKKSPDNIPSIIFLGDSLTAGFMLPVDQAYPSLIQKRLNEAKLRYAVINAGVSGDETIDAARRLEPLLRAHITLFVVALGINDGHRGKPIAEIRQNLRQILFRVTKAHPTAQLIVIAPGIRGSMPPEYWTEFENNYLLIANEFNATHVPALLNGVANVPERLLPRDPIHPNAKGHRTIAENIWPYIEKSLR